MSYVRGEVVLVTLTVRDPDTQQLIDPPDIQAKVWAPAATGPETLTFIAGTVERLSLGRYRFLIDTSPATGMWRYRVQTEGDATAVKQRSFKVTASW